MAAGVRTFTAWGYPPVLPIEALDFLRDNPEFFEHDRRPWPARATRIPLTAVVTNPHVLVGTSFVTRGTVYQAVPGRQGPDGRSWSLLIRPAADATNQADCDVVLPLRAGPKPGGKIDVEATVVAWGSLNIRAGKKRNHAALACRTARVVARP